MDMDAAAAAADAAQEADHGSGFTNGTSSQSLPMPSSPPQHDPATPQPQQPPQKRKMRITHDKYVMMQEYIVLHVADVEQVTGTGIEANDLMDWYLESKEEEFENEEQMEQERELLGKVLKKLVKVRRSTKQVRLGTNHRRRTDI
jgi:DNA replication licensing factor MCM6